MIDTAALRKSIIDLATSGQLSSICDGDDSIRKILAQLPVVSTKRKNFWHKNTNMMSCFRFQNTGNG